MIILFCNISYIGNSQLFYFVLSPFLSTGRDVLYIWTLVPVLLQFPAFYARF